MVPFLSMTKLLWHRLSKGRSVTRSKPSQSQPAGASAPAKSLRLFSIWADRPPKKPRRVISTFTPKMPSSMG